MAAGALFVREQNVMQVGVRFKQYRVFLVLDSSGSMAGRPWNTVVSGVQKILQHLDDDDRISAYLFSDNVREVMSFEPATDRNCAALHRALQNNKCGGSTALYDAIALAVKKTITMSLLAKMLVADKEKYIVVVLTDGENNRGQMSLAKTKEMMGELAELGELCSTTFIGVNLSYSAGTALKSLADAGGEHSEFHEIGTMEIEAIFDRIAITLQAARRVTVQGVVATGLGAGGGGSRPMLTDSSSRDVDEIWQLMQGVHQGVKSDMLGNVSLSKPSTLSGLYGVLKTYEAALSSEAQTAEWKSYKRRNWLQEVNNTSKYSRAHFVSCLYAMEGELRQEAQEPLWLMLQRPGWKSACERMGAYNLNLGSASNRVAIVPVSRPTTSSQRAPARRDNNGCVVS